MKYRLITREDLDGLMCAVLLKEKKLLKDIKFVSYRNINQIKITENDIIANLPYQEQAKLNFDHHESEKQKNTTLKKNYISDIEARSVSRVIFNYYGASKFFKNISWKTIKQIDNIKGNGITYYDIKEPKLWVLLSIILDERTNIENFKDELNYEKEDISLKLIESITKTTIEEFMKLPSIIERIKLIEKYKEEYIAQLERNITIINDNIILLDRTADKILYPGNRLLPFIIVEEEVNYLINIIKKPNNLLLIAVRQNPLEFLPKKHIGNLLFNNFNGGGNSISGTFIINDNQKEKENTIKKLKKILN